MKTLGIFWDMISVISFFLTLRIGAISPGSSDLRRFPQIAQGFS
jgi:hypothetical protein